MAPELLKRETVCHHPVDYWAVGCFLTFVAFKSSFFHYAAYSLAREYNVPDHAKDDNKSSNPLFNAKTQIFGILATLGCHSLKGQDRWRSEVETFANVEYNFCADIQREFKDGLTEKLGKDGLAFVDFCGTMEV